MADRVAQRLPEHKKAAEPLLSTSRPSLQQTPIFKSEDALQKLEEPGKEEALQQKPIFESAATPPIDEGEGDEPHYRERGNEDLLQLKCAECAAE
ncbi:MAG TPA: hypothetical protein PLI01_15515, partial [Nitrospira sp.]|nr:hypothetical protein [Nitrospira sp.]